MDLILFLIRISLIAIPLYIANSMPVLFKGKKPIDFGIKLSDRQRLFGKTKSIKGFIAGALIGSLAGIALSLIPGNPISNFALASVLLAFGAVLGDLIASFFKRRFGFESGKEIILLDQLDFLVVGLLFSSMVINFAFEEIIALIIVTLVAHKLGNLIGFALKLKKVPW